MAIKREKKYNTYDVTISFTMEAKGKTAKDAERYAANYWRDSKAVKNLKIVVEWPFGDSIAETEQEKEWEAHMDYQDLCKEETNVALSGLAFEKSFYDRMPLDECEEGEDGSL